MNRTAFSLPARSQYRSRGGLEISRAVEQFTGGANRLDDLIELLDRRRGVVLSSGTTVPGRYESFDLGFSDPPLGLETAGSNFSLQALNGRGEVLIAEEGDQHLAAPVQRLQRKVRSGGLQPERGIGEAKIKALVAARYRGARRQHHAAAAVEQFDQVIEPVGAAGELLHRARYLETATAAILAAGRQ